MYSEIIKFSLRAIVLAGCCLGRHCYAHDNNDAISQRRSVSSGELFSKVKDSLAIIECPGVGAGSGFIAGGWLYTNEHVIRDANKIIAKKLSGEAITFVSTNASNQGGNSNGSFDIWLEVAVDRDLARIKVADSSGLNTAAGAVNIGQKVWTFGNSDGGAVATNLRGEVIGVGPDSIEVDIPFVQGNSGGAILTEKGEVCGVVTYATINKETDNWIKSGTRFNEVRRFGLTLNGAQWTPIQWNGYVNRCKKLAEIKSMNDFLLANLKPWPWAVKYIVREKTTYIDRYDYRLIAKDELKKTNAAKKKEVSWIGEPMLKSYFFSILNADFSYAVAVVDYIDKYVASSVRKEERRPGSINNFTLDRKIGPNKPDAQAKKMLDIRIKAAKAIFMHLDKFEIEVWKASNLKKEFLNEKDLAYKVYEFLKETRQEDWVKISDGKMFGDIED